jgi:hypothetical protein
MSTPQSQPGKKPRSILPISLDEAKQLHIHQLALPKSYGGDPRFSANACGPCALAMCMAAPMAIQMDAQGVFAAWRLIEKTALAGGAADNKDARAWTDSTEQARIVNKTFTWRGLGYMARRVNSPAEMNASLAKDRPIMLAVNLMPPYSLINGADRIATADKSASHFIAVLAKIASGYIVADPWAKAPEIMTETQLRARYFAGRSFNTGADWGAMTNRYYKASIDWTLSIQLLSV